MEEASTSITNAAKTLSNTKFPTESYADKVGSNSESATVNMMTNLAKQMLDKQTTLSVEREKREKNVLMYNVDDKSTDKDADKTFFQNLCEKTLEMDSTPEAELTRIPTKNPKYFKPVKVQFKSIWDKRKFLSNLYKLKLDEKMNSIRVAHDMCQVDRDENKKLLEKAYQQNIHEKPKDFRYKVRGPPWEQKIVKVTQKN